MLYFRAYIRKRETITKSAKGEEMLDYFLNPPCPRFPDASLRVGRMARWLYSFCTWLGIRLGLLGLPLMILSSRAREVEWVRTPVETRMKAMCVVSIAVIGAFALFGAGISGAVRPAGKIT